MDNGWRYPCVYGKPFVLGRKVGTERSGDEHQADQRGRGRTRQHEKVLPITQHLVEGIEHQSSPAARREMKSIAQHNQDSLVTRAEIRYSQKGAQRRFLR